jgi:hypothetical protein
MKTDYLESYLAADLVRRGGTYHLPEYQPIKFYSDGVNSGISIPNDRDICNVKYSDLMDSTTAFLLLDAHFRSLDPGLEDLNYVRRYIALKKTTRLEKLVAQVYRILNIYHQATVYAPDKMDHTDELVRTNYVHRKIAYGLIITKTGLTLCDSFVLYYLNSFSMPYSENYVEAMLTSYYSDIVGQIKKMFDEEGGEQLFRPKYDFSRRYRYYCPNARYDIGEGSMSFEIEERYSDSRIYPIDFLVSLTDGDYIIPVEALVDLKISLEDLHLWKVRKRTETVQSYVCPDDCEITEPV